MIIVITGPTATGKTKLSIELAKKLDGEIINADSTQVFKDLDKRGCYVMLSNHNTLLVNELYKGYHFHIIEAKRNINANGKKRGKVEELIITNYENKNEF